MSGKLGFHRWGLPSLTSSEIRKLKRKASNCKLTSQERTRARVILLAAKGKSDAEIATELEVQVEAVAQLRARFARRRLAAVENAEAPVFLDLQRQASDAPRAAVRILLTGSETRELKRIVKAGKSEQRLAQRAKVILLAATRMGNSEIAAALGCHVQTVRKWRRRFAEDRMEGLFDLARAGRPMKFGPAEKTAAINLLLQPTPEERTRWTLELAAQVLVSRELVKSISVETLSRWLRAAEIRPHRFKSWLNCKDPEFNSKMEKVVALYGAKPNGARVLCIDEKTCIQANERRFADQKARPGHSCRKEFEYKRHGTVNLLAAYDPHTGKVVAECVDRNDSLTFTRFLVRLRRLYRNETLYFILDNGTTHRSKETSKFLRRHKWIGSPVFLPVHASWLNQIEVWFSVLSRQALRHTSFRSRDQLIARICSYVEAHNKICRPYQWTTHSDALRVKGP